MSLSSVQPNPSFGQGIFRRRVRLENRPGAVLAELEDCAHGFRLHLRHDGSTVTSIAAETLRIPMTTCGEAGRPLAGLINCALTADWSVFQSRLPAAANCTYLRDLAWWSMAHAQRSEATRDYEIAVTDEATKPAECSVWRNGELVFRWEVSNGTVVAPLEIAGRSMMNGFSSWVTSAFRGDAFEAAVVLQRGYFVSRGRRIDKRTLAGVHALTSKHMHGACFSFSPGAVERAVFTDSDRDFTNARELLLRFA